MMEKLFWWALRLLDNVKPQKIIFSTTKFDLFIFSSLNHPESQLSYQRIPPCGPCSNISFWHHLWCCPLTHCINLQGGKSGWNMCNMTKISATTCNELNSLFQRKQSFALKTENQVSEHFQSVAVFIATLVHKDGRKEEPVWNQFLIQSCQVTNYMVLNCDCKSAAVFRRKKLVAQSTVWTWTFYL